MASIEKMLDARIQECLEKLETETDIEERKILNETINTLYKQKILEKEKALEKKESKAKLELEKEKINLDLVQTKAIEEQKIKEQKKSRIQNAILSVVSLLAGIGTSVYGMKTVLKYEETGIFTSILSKDTIHNLIKRK